jgi:glutathione S-transferase
MLKILGHRGSSNVQKVLWCCGELGVPFEQRDVGGPFGGNRSPEYVVLNPNGLVPTIDDDGFILWESNAIVRYLAAKHGAGSLCPADLSRRADAERWMDWQQTTLTVPMGVLFRALLRSPPDATEPAALDAAREKAGASWGILDRQLAKAAFVAGEHLTIGDIALGNAVHRWFKLPIERPELANLKGWYARLCKRPAYKQHIAGV